VKNEVDENSSDYETVEEYTDDEVDEKDK